MHPFPRVVPVVSLMAALVLGGAAAAQAADGSQVIVPPMKTSIYVGTVTLTTDAFRQQGEEFITSYEAKVRPWFFWSETGKIVIRMPPADFERLGRGETVEFTGAAANHKGKPRTVTGRARPANANDGEIKVRIAVDGAELVFNGTYRIERPPAADTVAAN